MRMETLMRQRLMQERRRLERVAQSRIFERPDLLLDGIRMRLSESERALERAINEPMMRARHALSQAAGRLEALSPLSVLSRGYTVVYKEDKAVTRAEQVGSGDALRIRFADGAVSVRVDSREGEKQDGKENGEL